MTRPVDQAAEAKEKIGCGIISVGLDGRSTHRAAPSPVGLLGKTDRPGLGDALKPGGDVDAVTKQIAVGFLDRVAEMNADAKLDSALRRQASVALDEAVLRLALDGA